MNHSGNTSILVTGNQTAGATRTRERASTTIRRKGRREVKQAKDMKQMHLAHPVHLTIYMKTGRETGEGICHAGALLPSVVGRGVKKGVGM